MSIFLVLTAIFFLGSLTAFVAGTFLFINIQIFYELYSYYGMWIAYFAVITGSILFSYLAFMMIQNMFFRAIKKKAANTQSGAINFILTNKTLISFVLYEILKFYLKKIKK